MGILDSIPWDKLFEWLFKYLENCNTQSEDSAVHEIRNPGRVTRWRFRRSLAKDGVTLTEEQWNEVYRTAATASQLELQQLVREAWGMF